ncbi:hypothetical protein MSP8886_01436 [Marinomonas spartinae]|jgi:hypothetical protein|uniref:Uncharacterized protein n=1 Tax=Marinomonas spartinae TaxID=1792290 RepID=A0A1A8T9F9_9GAMM|nr:hypothetical protein [Marinomonas spartinae]SBS29098.1 hypothetical protein MSP8886_01436 [Marinomonas spartinae]
MNKLEMFRLMSQNFGEEAFHESAPEQAIVVRFKNDFLDGNDFVGEGNVLTVADVDIPENPLGSKITIAGTAYYLRQPVGGGAGVTKYQVEKVM